MLTTRSDDAGGGGGSARGQQRERRPGTCMRLTISPDCITLAVAAERARADLCCAAGGCPLAGDRLGPAAWLAGGLSTSPRTVHPSDSPGESAVLCKKWPDPGSRPEAWEARRGLPL
ncbi:hypothetical protein ABPG75_000589 [Micractinium tetrahymenae]